MRDPRRIPDGLREHVEQAGDAEPATPRNAASIVLVRDTQPRPGGLGVFLLHRHAGMAFAASMAVFPGGGVDPRDLDAAPDASWAGPSPDTWAATLSTTADVARGVVCAAVRELFEESGVLLAGSDDATVVPSTAGADWERDRERLEARELSFSELLTERGLRVRTDLLTPWSCWITPVFEPRRYRTWFFAAALPDGQVTRDVSGETEGVEWTTVADALRADEAGTFELLPPQYCTLLELFEHTTAADLRTAERTPLVVEPSAFVDGGTVRLDLPGELVDLARIVGERLT